MSILALMGLPKPRVGCMPLVRAKSRPGRRATFGSTLPRLPTTRLPKRRSASTAKAAMCAAVGPPGACGGMSRRRTPKHSTPRSLLDPSIDSSVRPRRMSRTAMNCAAYSRLSEVARDYLAVPATGAPIERVFSGGTDMVSPKRGCLAADTIRACLCLKSWL